MARKVFISVLGTGFYKPCVYGKTDIKTRFIQVATLLNIKAKEWHRDDAGVVLLTDLARRTNWVIPDNKRENQNKGIIEDYRGLKLEIETLGLPFTVSDIHIPDGKNEEEMWTIFTTLFEALHDGDELYIDLTHAFRYLPMLVLVLTNYAKFLKGIAVKSLTYGNYEARNDDLAPIVDLLPIAALQDWTTAAADYLNNGFAGRIKELTDTTLRPLMCNETTRSQNLVDIKKFSSSIENLSNERILCRGAGISKGANVNNLVTAANQIEKMTVAPLKPIMEKIIASVDNESNTDIKRCTDAARWCYNKHLYQQAITILQEGIVTFFCSRHNISIDDENMRGLVNSAFWGKAHSIEDVVVNPEHLDSLEAILNDNCMSEELANLFSKITDLRNDFNHAGFNKKATKNPNDIIKKINTYITLAEDILLNKSE